MEKEAPFRQRDDGIVIFARVTPRAARDAVGGRDVASDGRVRLKIRVRAVPDKGKANEGVIKVLAKALRCAKSDLSIVAGATDRNKSILVKGAGPDLAARLALLLEDPS